jgi:hypothetical protein
MNEDKFESFLQIDETVLDKQAAQQPRLMWTYSKMAAKANQKLDEEEAELKVVECEVDEAIRSAPEKFGLDKITEPAIKRAILRAKEYQKALKNVIKARSDLRLCQAAVATLDHRRTSISNFVKLSEQNYFARPHQSAESKDKSPHRQPLPSKRRRPNRG